MLYDAASPDSFGIDLGGCYRERRLELGHIHDDWDAPVEVCYPLRLHRELLRLLAGVTDEDERAEIISEYWRGLEDAEELDREAHRPP